VFDRIYEANIAAHRNNQHDKANTVRWRICLRGYSLRWTLTYNTAQLTHDGRWLGAAIRTDETDVQTI